ncbi:hypothetical protein HZA56_08900 [Candidatus Poribacteria bacterium]|nr:hypothetical protein [Candidatus Poribacteria bacterium]
MDSRRERATTKPDGTTGLTDRGKPTIFYGITLAVAAELLGLKRFCPHGM